MKTNTSQTCPVCGGTRGPGLTTFSVELGFGVLVVRHVPATVCTQCGADWISDDVAAQLEDRVSAAREKHAEVEVVAFA